MKAIVTKYLPATNTRGSRLKASADGLPSVTIPYPHELSGEQCHLAAVRAFVAKHHLAWDVSTLVYGGLPDNSGYAFCFRESVIR